MSDMEMKNSSPEVSTNVNLDAVESPDRRTFIKGTVMAAGAVAASNLVASSAEAAPTVSVEPAQNQPAAFARSPVAQLRLNFNRQKPPTVQDIQAILPAIFRLTGCVACGLVGLDLSIGINEVLPVVREDLNLTLEGTIAGR